MSENSTRWTKRRGWVRRAGLFVLAVLASVPAGAFSTVASNITGGGGAARHPFDKNSQRKVVRDTDGACYVVYSYRSGSRNQIRIARSGDCATGWESYILSTNAAYDFYFPSIDTNDAGTELHVVYYHSVNGGRVHYTKNASLTGTGWKTAANWTKANGSAGVDYVACATNWSSQWPITCSGNTSYNNVVAPVIAVDDSGVPHVAYPRRYNASGQVRAEVHYSYWTGSAWSAQQRVSNLSGGNEGSRDEDLAPSIDWQDGYVHILYADESSYLSYTYADRYRYVRNTTAGTYTAFGTPVTVMQNTGQNAVPGSLAADGAKVWTVGGWESAATNSNMFNHSLDDGVTWTQGTTGAVFDSTFSENPWVPVVGVNPGAKDHRAINRYWTNPKVIQSYLWDGSTFGTRTSTGEAVTDTHNDSYLSIEKHKLLGATDMIYCWYYGTGTGDAIRCSSITGLDTPLVGWPSLSVTAGTNTFTVTSLQTFEAVFDTTAGGGIKDFYDLNEDPVRAYDLAGGTGTSTTSMELVNQRITASGGSVGDFLTGANDSAVDFAKLEILEATPIRVRLRSKSFFEKPGTSEILPGVKVVRDWTVYGGGRMSYGSKLRTTRTPLLFSVTNRRYELVAHYLSSGPLSNWAAAVRNTTLALPGPSMASFGGQDFIMTYSDPGVSGLLTDFMMNQAYPIPTSVNQIQASRVAAEQAVQVAWVDNSPVTALPSPSGSYSTDNGESWDGSVWFKPNDLAYNSTEAFYRVSDHNLPDDLTFTRGSGWYDASEHSSSPSDEFNDDEGAYVLDMNPSTGLAFDISWKSFFSAPRWTPFFKIRGWRSFGPPSVTLEGTSLAYNDDFESSVKPVSRAHLAEKLLWHSTLQNSTAVLPRPTGTLDVGAGGGANGITYQSARFGSGAYFNNTSDYINAITGVNGFDGAAGAVEFWYQPTYDHTSTSTHPFWRTMTWGSQCMGFIHYNARLYFRASATSSTCSSNYSEVNVPSTAYSWKAYDWVHLRVDWSAARKMRVFVNGKLVGDFDHLPHPHQLPEPRESRRLLLQLHATGQLRLPRGDHRRVPRVRRLRIR